jgi:hypothetical protein
MRTVSIATVLTDLFNQPEYQSTGIIEEPSRFIEYHLEELHKFDKEIMTKLLTAEMCRRIALET